MKIKWIFLILVFLFAGRIMAQETQPVQFPDILGYKTLKCDFHLHTVFSDGQVWPTTRVDEAWRDGLDILSITDHIEYRPNLNSLAGESNIPADHDQPYRIAIDKAEKFGILLIKGAEMTRTMPPGHLNALFLTDIDSLDTPWVDDGTSRQGWKKSGLLIDNWKDAFYQAKKQGALIFWNHPGWKTQQPDSTLWWPEHTWLLENHFMDGIEVVNGNYYSPEAHQWAIDKNLTIVSGSDSHGPATGKNRPVTLVFASHRKMDSIREALINHRSAVFFDNKLIGNEIFLNAIFAKSITVESVVKNAEGYIIVIRNNTGIPFELSGIRGNDSGQRFPDRITIPQGRKVLVPVLTDNPSGTDKIEMQFMVNNLLVAPGKGLTATISVSTNE